jgi:hypothetical protein
MKKTILALIAGIAGHVQAANWTNYPFATPGPNDTFLFAVLTTNQFGVVTNAQIIVSNLSTFFATNIPYAAVTNPLTSGVNYTSPPTRGFLTVNVVVTNSGTAVFTNRTSTAVQLVGSLNGTGTNYHSIYMRTGPGDVVLFTNGAAGVGVLSSRWQP